MLKVLKLSVLAILVSIQVLSAQIPSKNGGYWYRGNTHTHARFSDEEDKNDVPVIASWYKKAGYNFLLLSEHNDHLSEKKVFCHDEASHPPLFIMICGLELSESRHHTAFGIDRFIGGEKSLQDGVNKTLSAGGVPILNHPQDPVVRAADFIATKGLNHLEIVNGGRLEDTPATEMLWDSILSAPDGRRVFAVASDDNHYKEANVGRGWIMVNARSLTKEDIEENIRSGNFYATTGVILNDFSVNNKSVSVSSQNGDSIIFIGRNGKTLKIISGDSGTYSMTGNELYIRAKIINTDGKMAWTQPDFVTSEQKYITVEAQRRIYGQNGVVTYSKYEPFKTRTVELLDGYKSPKKAVSLSKYGGWLDHKVTSTGFFHTEKIGDRWWCIDPEGYLYFNVALNSISMGGSERNKQAVKDKFGTSENWISATVRMLQENGFNCAGSWSDYKAVIEANKKSDKPFAYTINWNFMSSYGRERGGTYQQPGHTGYPGDAIFVFDPGWEAFCDRHAQQAAAYKDDPNLFGYFSDNEMPFKFKSLDNYLALSEKDPGHIAAVKWLEDNNIKKEQITDKHREAFMAVVADKYFSVVSAALKKYDPNHMYIGARFYSSEKNYPEFMRTAGRYADIISNNYYGKWTPDSADMANWTNWSGKPFLITEYYTKGEDSGMPNQSGAGWIVKTQSDRGLFYQNYNLALLESKNCVGWHYFKYQDNDPTATGVDPSNTDSNKGIVNNYYEVWTPMMELMKELNTQVYNIIEYFDNK